MSVIISDIRYYAAYAMPLYDGSSTLAAAITTTSAASLTITSAASFPQTGEFLIQIDTEYMLVTQGAGTTTWTIIRGVLGSTAATHSLSAAVTTFAGGPQCPFAKIAFSQLGSGDTVDYVSTSTADTFPQITVTGRDTTGVLKTETKTLNGQTVVAGSQAFGRVLRVDLAAAQTLNGDVTNVATTVVVAASTGLPTSGNYYARMGTEIVQVTAGQGTASLTVSRGQLGTTATAHVSGDNFYVCPAGDVAIVDHTATISGHTAQSGSANPTGTTPALFKLQASDGSAVSVGQLIHTTGGTGPNQVRTIIATTGYGTDIVAVSRSWGSIPDGTTTYNVQNGFQLDAAPNAIFRAHPLFANALADVVGGSDRSFYEKIFIQNDNTTIAFTNQSGNSAVTVSAAVSPALPGTASLGLATSTAADDVVAWATRQTAPGSGYSGFTTQPAAVNLGANSGNLASGAAPNTANSQGIVAKFTLPAGTSPYLGSVTFTSNGATT